MNYLIHNEVDLIEANIRYHASLGIDSFVVMDNGSTDGSYEAVEKLAQELAIILLRRPQLDYRQSEWKTEMARLSSKHGADWSIANDADEFWLPKGGSFAPLLPCFAATCYCKRYNMLPAHEDFCAGRPWYEAQYLVRHPVQYAAEDILRQDNLSIMLHRIHGKLIVKNLGLVRVHGGNHRASHLFNPLWKKDLADVDILHYPLRDRKTWLDNLRRREKLLAGPRPRMGNHYRRWVRQLKQESLDEEIKRLAPDKKDLLLLEELGVVENLQNGRSTFTNEYDVLKKQLREIYAA